MRGETDGAGAGGRQYGRDALVTFEHQELWRGPLERKVIAVLEAVQHLVPGVSQRRGGLFEGGCLTRHSAVVPDRFEFDGNRCLENAGSIEAMHHAQRNKPAADAMSSARLGANAGRLQVAVSRHNVLMRLKRAAWKPEYPRARPRRLRFGMYCPPGELIHQVRRVAAQVQRKLEEWEDAWEPLPAVACGRPQDQNRSLDWLESPLFGAGQVFHQMWLEAQVGAAEDGNTTPARSRPAESRQVTPPWSFDALTFRADCGSSS